MLEVEKTYLIKHLPEGLSNCRHKQILDLYLPASSDHPKLRIRKNGDKYEITKKTLVNENDVSVQNEENIHLTKEEFDAVIQLPGKRVNKHRYYYPYMGRDVEIDVFQDDLKGLVLVDVEFETEDHKTDYPLPEFCLAEVTQEKSIAGGMLCGKSYSDIQDLVQKYGYKKIDTDL